MGWIKERIDAEYRKHKDLDWSKIAEAKIQSQIKDAVEKIIKKNQTCLIDVDDTECDTIKRIHKELLKLLEEKK
jgi:hypothetical protein